MFDNRFYSLKSRCEKIKQKFDFTMYPKHLWSVYKREGIEFKRVPRKMKASFAMPAYRKNMRTDFVTKLLSLIA